jgi:hypothetical protein
MGTDITPGHNYVDGDDVSGPSLTEHVSEAIIKPSFISAKAVRTLALADEFLVRDTVGDAFGKATLQALLNRVVTPGSVIQTQYSEYLANTNLVPTIPTDDTIPQNVEGTEILTCNITPIYATSTILVRFNGMFTVDRIAGATAALFRNAAVPALMAIAETTSANEAKIFHFEFLDTPSSTTLQTYRIRTGPNAVAIMRFNGNITGRFFGGVARTTLTVQEIKQ